MIIARVKHKREGVKEGRRVKRMEVGKEQRRVREREGEREEVMKGRRD